MGNNTKENRRKKKEREKSQLWAAKVSFVAGWTVIIEIGKDLLKYLNNELPLYVNVIYTTGVLFLLVLVLKNRKLDKYLRSKSVENYGIFLTVASIIVFIMENLFFKMEMSTIVIVGVCIIYVMLVVGAVYLLFIK